MQDTLDHLPDRAVLSLDGPDTIALLERLVTHTTEGWEEGAARYGALLTPQGKIIADFIALRTQDGVLLDVHEEAIEDLARRLKLFRLRAKVEIAPAKELGVFIGAGFADPRSPALPPRTIGPLGDGPEAKNYDAARLAADIPEMGRDFGASEVFPTDVNMDRLGGIDYYKGCFVGQEVVSRMYRRGRIRKRTIAATGEGLASGMAVTAGGRPLGEITSTDGTRALIRLRTDRLAAALEADAPIEADGQTLRLTLPAWLDEELAAQAADG